MHVKQLGRAAVAGLLVTGLSACGMATDTASADGVNVLTWDHGLSLPGTAYEEVMTVDLPQIIEEATDGKVVVEVTAGQTDPTETLSAIQNGRFDGGTIVATNYAGTYPLWGFGEVGFMVDDFDQWEEIQRGEAGEFVRTEFESDTGLVQPGGAVPWASSYLFTNYPLNTVDDWNGLRIRAGSIETSNLMEAFGASAVSMPFGDLYTSLERGVVDGFMTSQNAALAINPWEVIDYVNLWPAGIGHVYPAINPDFLAELDDETRAQLEEAFDELIDLAWVKTHEDEERTQTTMQENGMTVITPDEAVLDAARANHGQSFLDDWLARTGPRGQEVLDILGK